MLLLQNINKNAFRTSGQIHGVVLMMVLLQQTENLSTARPAGKLQVTRSPCTLDVNYTSTTSCSAPIYLHPSEFTPWPPYRLSRDKHIRAHTHKDTHTHTRLVSCAMPIMAVCLLVWFILLGNLLARGAQLSQVTYDERATIFSLCHSSNGSYPFSYELNYALIPQRINNIDSHLLQFLSLYFNKFYVKIYPKLWQRKTYVHIK